MARKRKKKALYEVIGKTWSKPSGRVAGQQLPGEESGKEESTVEKAAAAKPEKVSQWPKRPRVVQFNAGRVEISMPYQLAIAVLLGILLLILVFFRLGQSYSTGQAATDSAAGTENIGREGSTGSETTGTGLTEGTASITEGVESTGDNVIVLVEYGRYADLVPVVDHYREHGIEIEIVPAPDGRYFLWTKERYENTDKRGAPGYEAKRRIMQVGVLYKGKAPEGLETFAPHYFSDAYGMKVK